VENYGTASMKKVRKKVRRQEKKNRVNTVSMESKKKSKSEPILANRLFPVKRRKKQRKRIEKEPLI
jgi:hypothetical protein